MAIQGSATNETKTIGTAVMLNPVSQVILDGSFQGNVRVHVLNPEGGGVVNPPIWECEGQLYGNRVAILRTPDPAVSYRIIAVVTGTVNVYMGP